MPELRGYLDHRGRNPFNRWLEQLDSPARVRIVAILDRMRAGNLGDVRSVGNGVLERRVWLGPGYRIYFAWDGPKLIILLGGGDKSDQRDDITRAQERWLEYQNRDGD